MNWRKKQSNSMARSFLAEHERHFHSALARNASQSKPEYYNGEKCDIRVLPCFLEQAEGFEFQHTGIKRVPRNEWIYCEREGDPEGPAIEYYGGNCFIRIYDISYWILRAIPIEPIPASRQRRNPMNDHQYNGAVVIPFWIIVVFLLVLILIAAIAFFYGYQKCAADVENISLNSLHERFRAQNARIDSIAVECGANRACWLSLMPIRFKSPRQP